MSLQSRLAPLIAAIGADIKALNAPDLYCRIRVATNASSPSSSMPQMSTPFNFGASPQIFGNTGLWNATTVGMDITKTGRWLIGCEVLWAAQAAEQVRDVILSNNGSTRLVEDRVSMATGVIPWLKGSDVVELTAGDLLQMFVSQATGAAINVLPGSKMHAYYLGPST